MENGIKLSVIIPCYNVEKYLRQCLDSVINQTLKEIEIICVNDGSTDGTQKILEEYAKKDNRILVINKPNGGQASARNAGMEKMQGEYVAFLDSDDWVDLNFYEKLYNATKRNNVDFAIGEILLHNSNNEVSKKCLANIPLFKLKTGSYKHINDKSHVIYSCSVCNKLYKANIIKENKLLFPQNLLLEDILFNFQASVITKSFVLVPDVRLYYRQHSTSTMSNIVKSDRIFDIFKIYELCEEFLEQANLPKKLKKRYKNILDNFKIFNLYIYYSNCPKEFKDEFREKMLSHFDRANIFFNPYINNDSRCAIVKVFLNRCKRFMQKLFNKQEIKNK